MRSRSRAGTTYKQLTIYSFIGKFFFTLCGQTADRGITPPLRRIERTSTIRNGGILTVQSPGVRTEIILRANPDALGSQRDAEDSMADDLQCSQRLQGGAQLQQKPSPHVLHGVAFRYDEGTHAKKQRIAHKVSQRIEDMYADIKGDNAANYVFTTNIDNTPKLSTIYQKAYDKIVPEQGIQGPTLSGTNPVDEAQVREIVRNSSTSQEAIVSAWGFNFNDSQYPKKRNFYHVI